MEILLLSSATYGSLVLLSITVVFVLSRLLEDNSIMDIAYGPIFAISAALTMVLTSTYTFLALLITSCITLWATRLSVRILRKNWRRPEDPRYRAWRERWMHKGLTYFLIRSFLQVNLLQGVIIVVVALPFIIAFAAGSAYSTIFTMVGLTIFLFGLGFEALADWQLDQFIKKKRRGETKTEVMQKGLFQYSRRPNYFGETVVWWGLAIMVLPLPYGWLALTSPVLITFIVTYVTGPMIERQFMEKYPEEYGNYQTRTSYFLPLPPRNLV